jgi:hypothetical protein
MPRTARPRWSRDSGNTARPEVYWLPLFGAPGFSIASRLSLASLNTV